MSSSQLDEYEARAAALAGEGGDLESGGTPEGDADGGRDAGSPLLSDTAGLPRYGAGGGSGSGDGDDDIQVRADAGAANGAAASPPKKAKKDKSAAKSGQKAVSDALKTDMAAERTFFKWLWTGLHTGAIGTFIFVTFDADKSDPYRVAVVAFAWGVAFLLVLYGLYAYNRRRAALRDGRVETIPAITREWGPCIVVVAIMLVVGVGLTYAVFSGASPKKSHKSDAFGALGA